MLSIGYRVAGARISIAKRSSAARLILATLDCASAAQLLPSPRRAQDDLQNVLMFSGHGWQYVNIGIELDESPLRFRENVGRGCELLEPHLIASDVRSRSTIAVCIRRTTKMVVAILGFLTSGGGHLLLAPTYS